MQSQPQNSEFRNNPENFHPCAVQVLNSSQPAKLISKIFVTDLLRIIMFIPFFKYENTYCI